MTDSTHRSAKWALTAGILLACAALSFRQASHWQNTETLFSHNLAINPRSEVANDNYAGYLIAQGRPSEALALSEATLRLNSRSSIAQGNRASALAALGRRDEALLAYRAAVACDPQRAQAHISLADALTQAGNLPEAEDHYRQALSLEPKALLARFNYGLLLQRQDRYVEAAGQFEAMLKQQPDHYEARMRLGRLLARRGDFAAAAEHFAYLVNTTGDLAARVQWAETLVGEGKMEAAYAQYREALREPSAAWPPIAARAAWLLATHPRADARDGRQALQLALEANRLTGSQQAELIRSLAAAYAETGDFEQAIQSANAAHQWTAPNGALRVKIETDRRSYLMRTPVRQQPTYP